MQKLESRFHLRGRSGEVITVTVNGERQLVGVVSRAGSTPVHGGTFTLSGETATTMLAVSIDFNQADGERFEIVVSGDEPGGFVSKCPVRRNGAFRNVHYHFQVG